ncbi:hypothetical protein BT67DRAFT_94042 [Trichocladium antarcticum]|uniref:Uncharacterized protein n=1 Tax=Trichocladium antarcticum TaxID=1450529 RepID=A0AAN6ZAU2_9PEZI|nr:hypothetical protein BT67DRAFT_94042 [Trichocladium antarcticum]
MLRDCIVLGYNRYHRQHVVCPPPLPSLQREGAHRTQGTPQSDKEPSKPRWRRLPLPWTEFRFHLFWAFAIRFPNRARPPANKPTNTCIYTRHCSRGGLATHNKFRQ